MTYDLIIIGGGPAACAAAVYAARKQLKTLLVAEEIGGQSNVSETIYNWIGTKEISGTDLAKSLHEHIKAYAGENGFLTLLIGKRVEKIEKPDQFVVTLSNGETAAGATVLVATGSRHKKLDIPGAAEYDNKGIMYCATCDGPLFAGQPVAVIGGGNAGFEAAAQLAQYAEHVTLLHRSENFRADQITVDMVLKNEKVSAVKNVELVSVQGSQFVESISYKIKGTDDVITLPVGAVFVEIGQLPNTELIAGLAERDELNRVVVDPKNQRTNVPGLWAAGDCTDGLYHQNNIAAGDAVKAIEDLYLWFKRGGK